MTAANRSRCGASSFSDSSEEMMIAARNGTSSSPVLPKASTQSPASTA